LFIVSLKLYSVTLELTDSGDYHSLQERLRALGATKIVAHQWALRTTHSAIELKDILRGFLAENDRIVVAELGAECASRRALANLAKL
jgi:hypothetical protein